MADAHSSWQHLTGGGVFYSVETESQRRILQQQDSAVPALTRAESLLRTEPATPAHGASYAEGMWVCGVQRVHLSRDLRPQPARHRLQGERLRRRWRPAGSPAIARNGLLQRR